MVYAVGGHGVDGESLSSAKAYDPVCDKWTLIASIHYPRWGCFRYCLHSRLYVMGRRSSFTIKNAKFVDVYSPEMLTLCKMKNGCKLLCMEWKDRRKLAICIPEDNPCKMVPVPLIGSSSIGHRFGMLNRKLPLLSMEKDLVYWTLSFDPDAASGSEWKTSNTKPAAPCLCCTTVAA
ncbi:hypothetical protein Nepgr_003343 [Nepenthes gracilis]|uniref:Uncharacterized protein n=1 Tax=Nepenthes gracilis TaxID=150966 RepID=A0AAD3RZF7_NEPGR|nr:hypothetical protein Nepgr_003343 [Nepenthes gracilis]